MTVKEVLEQWAVMPDRMREAYGKGLIDMLTPVGKALMKKFEDKWFKKYSDVDFGTFLQAQQARLRGILELVEMSMMGKQIRARDCPGTKQLTWNTEVRPFISKKKGNPEHN